MFQTTNQFHSFHSFQWPALAHTLATASPTNPRRTFCQNIFGPLDIYLLDFWKCQCGVINFAQNPNFGPFCVSRLEAQKSPQPQAQPPLVIPKCSSGTSHRHSKALHGSAFEDVDHTQCGGIPNLNSHLGVSQDVVYTWLFRKGKMMINHEPVDLGLTYFQAQFPVVFLPEPTFVKGSVEKWWE